MEEPKKKRKSNLPSKEDATEALELIKGIQKENDADLERKKKLEEAQREQEIMIAKEKAKIEEAQQKIKRALRERLKQKEKENQQKAVTNYLESGKKIKWKSLNGGNRIVGYYKNKVICEITRGLSLFNLYIKDAKILSEKKMKSYYGCSMDIQKLKDKSEKLI